MANQKVISVNGPVVYSLFLLTSCLLALHFSHVYITITMPSQRMTPTRFSPFTTRQGDLGNGKVSAHTMYFKLMSYTDAAFPIFKRKCKTYPIIRSPNPQLQQIYFRYL